MVNMAKFSTKELLDDLADTAADIKLCQIAINGGVTEYSGGGVQKRLDTNIKIRDIISAELERRERWREAHEKEENNTPERI